MLSSAEIPIQTWNASASASIRRPSENTDAAMCLHRELGSGQVHAATKPVLRQASCPLVARLMITS